MPTNLVRPWGIGQKRRQIDWNQLGLRKPGMGGMLFLKASAFPSLLREPESMTRETLQKSRLIVPGLMILIVLVSVLRPDFNVLRIFVQLDLLKEGIVGFLVIALFGALYKVLDVRAMLLGDFWVSIKSNIKARLLQALPRTREPGPEQAQALTAGRQLMDVFYGIIDNDETLKSRMAGVYFNGLLVTSSADLAVIAVVGALAHLVLALLGEPHHLTWAVFLAVISLLSLYGFLRKTIATHRRLSNEQLDYIATHCADRLQALISQAVSRLPQSTPGVAPGGAGTGSG